MGWERKRGKLMEFNRLLRGAIDSEAYASSKKVYIQRLLPDRITSANSLCHYIGL